MHQKDIYQKLAVIISVRRYFPFLLICFSEFFLEYIFIIFEVRRKEACTKSSTMGYMLYWKCAQYSEEAKNVWGSQRKSGNLYLSSLTLICVFHLPTQCNAWPSLDPGPSKPTVKILIRQVGNLYSAWIFDDT